MSAPTAGGVPVPTPDQNRVLVAVQDENGHTYADLTDQLAKDLRPCRKTTLSEAVRVDTHFKVHTLEGVMQGRAGDYLMRGAHGELYVCAADVFADTYQFVSED